MAERTVNLVAQPGDERGETPARFQLAPRADGGAPLEDLRIGALKRVEGRFEAEPEQAARFGKIVICSCRQQIDVGRVAAHHADNVAFERRGIAAVGKFDSRHQLGIALDDRISRLYRDPWIDGRVDETFLAQRRLDHRGHRRRRRCVGRRRRRHGRRVGTQQTM